MKSVIKWGLYPNETYDGLLNLCVHGVRDEWANDPNADGTNCVIDDKDPQFFSLYGLRVELEYECLGDFATREEALNAANTVSKAHNIPVTCAMTFRKEDSHETIINS